MEKVMRGEHFLLLAEREQLLAPVVLTQLRGILAQQRRPATGEAIARLLVDRSYLTVEQARHLIAAGSAAKSPLVPQPTPQPSAFGGVKNRNPAAPESDELSFAPDDTNADTQQVTSATTKVATQPMLQKSSAAASSGPIIPTDQELAELTDSLKQWMDLPGPLRWNAPPSPIFAQSGWKITPTMVWIGIAGVLVLFVLVFLVALARWEAG